MTMKMTMTMRKKKQLRLLLPGMREGQDRKLELTAVHHVFI